MSSATKQKSSAGKNVLIFFIVFIILEMLIVVGVGRVFKNKNMPGHYGNEQVTIQNLEIVKVDADRNILLVKGCVPGPKGAYLVIKETVKR